MFKSVSATLLAGCMLLTIGCTPLERSAYDTIVAAKAFLDVTKSNHPECALNPFATVCVDLSKATSAKDTMIDAAEIYCASTSFDTLKGACTPPAKGTPARDQAEAKLRAAMAAYNQTAADLKGVL